MNENMAKVDDFEIDIEGDFDVDLETNELAYDTDELPSKSANLLPEYTNPPWMLDQGSVKTRGWLSLKQHYWASETTSESWQPIMRNGLYLPLTNTEINTNWGWSSDHFIDEKSKATIEKMLQEEQHFVNGKQCYSGTLSHRSQSTSHRKPWSEEEKALFTKGLEIVGENWTKMTDIIPTRTNIQIRNYARQYLKRKVKKGEDTSKSLSTDFPSSSKIPPTPAEKVIVNGNIDGSVGKKSSTSYRKVNSECLKQVLQSVTTAQPTVKMTSPRNRNKTQNAAQVSKQKPAARKANKLVSPLKRKRLDGTNATDSKVFCPLSSDSSPIKNLEGFCVANGILQNDATKPSKSSSDRDDEDIEVDIEMDDNDGAPDSNQPPSPDSIYKSLLESAEISDSDAESNVSKDETEIVSGTSEKDNSSESEATPSESISFEEQLRGKSASLVKLAAPSSTSPVFTPEFQNDIQSDNKEKDNLNMVKADTDDILSAGSSTCDKLPPKIPEKFTHHIDNGFLSVDGNILEFPIPEKELCLPCDVISDEEQNINSEFFIGKPSKTPERYKKIRNFILDAWNKCKPSYLNKTSLRSGLKNCGDVNCIGRIHSYLECVGAINFGCEQAIYKNPIKLFQSGQLRNAHCRKEETRTLPQQPSSTTNIGLKFNGMRPRKRRVKDGSGNWIDEKDLEGRTIQHKDAPEEKPKIKICKTLKKPYDPFKLIPCSAFSDEKKSPFAVEIFSSVLTVMDIHAHISKTEVIGLLGGHYEVYENKLVISMVEPCRSLSTGMQCEMDPVSQTQACQVIHNRGLDILGWYHSHPNFAPNPSVRDIETQKKLQEWFSQGGSHFVGIIVSPYYNMNIISAIQCLTVSEEVVENHNVPYKFEYQITEDSNNERLVEQVVKLADSHSRNHSNVDLSKMYTPTSGISCLQKTYLGTIILTSIYAVSQNKL